MVGKQNTAFKNENDSLVCLKVVAFKPFKFS